MSRKEERKGFAGIEDCIDASIQGLEEYIKKSKERLITAANNSNNNISTDRKTTNTRKKKWEEQQYGYLKRQTSEIAHVKTWIWLRKGNYKRETKSLLIAAQNNIIKTNYVVVKMNNTQV